MTTLEYPTPLEQRVLAQEAPGGRAAEVRIVIPTITKVGEPFAARVAVVDETGFPCLQMGRAVRIRSAAMEPAVAEVPFTRGRPAVAAVGGLTICKQGLFRLSCRAAGRTFHSNPTHCQPQPAERIYWGDPHVHTNLGDCVTRFCRSSNFCYVAGRWVSGLDWVGAADHVSNGRCTLGKWRDQAATSNHFNEPGRFATLPGYEASLRGGAGGDNNVYMRRWPEMFVDEYEEGNVRTLCDRLGEALEAGEFFVVPHHTTRTGKHGEIPPEIYPGPELMPAVEIHSKWGASEYRGNPEPLHQVHAGPCYVTDLLAAGYPLGFVGGTDTHATMPGGPAPEPGHIDRPAGITAVRAPRLSRQDVFDAIRTRNCYAASAERTCLDVTVAGSPAGRIVDWADERVPRTVRVLAAAAGRIESVEVVRNGETIASHRPGSWTARFEHTDTDPPPGLWLDSAVLGRFVYYYVRVTCASGARAWSSPVWLRRS
ncbi:MAG: CehA/McbA family metallohydrolase domain-containing protein [Planctomycetota bacterium]|jgi:hypothetical protein